MAECVGCHVRSETLPCYNENNPVEGDGTYKDGKFVCDKCYIRLQKMGLGRGTPKELQTRAALFVAPLPTEVNVGGAKFAVVSQHTLEQAIADGILVVVGTLGAFPVVFNVECLKSLGIAGNPKAITALVQKGLDLLRKPDPEDEDGGSRLRVIEKDKLWVINDGQAVTFLRPEDY